MENKTGNTIHGEGRTASYAGSVNAEGQLRRPSVVADLNRGKNLDAKYESSPSHVSPSADPVQDFEPSGRHSPR